MAVDSPSAASSTSTQSPGASSSCSVSPQVFFGRQRSQHELRTLAKLQARNSSWDAAPTLIRRITKRDSREFHRRKTLLLAHPAATESSSSGTKQWEGGLEEREDVFGGVDADSGSGSDIDTISPCSLESAELETEDEQSSPRPFSFTFSLRQRHSPSCSPASSICSPISDHKLEQDPTNGTDAHCDLTFDFDNFVFSDVPRTEITSDGHDEDDLEEGPSVNNIEQEAVATPLGPEKDTGSWSEEKDQTTTSGAEAIRAKDLQEAIPQELSSVEPAESTSDMSSIAVQAAQTVEETPGLGLRVEIAAVETISQLEGGQEAPEDIVPVPGVSSSPAGPSMMTNDRCPDVNEPETHDVLEVTASAPASASTEVVSETTLEGESHPLMRNDAHRTVTSALGSNSSPLQQATGQGRRTPPSAAELASMVADDNVGLAELAAAVAAVNMSHPPASPDSDLDSPLPTFRAGPVIIPAILNRHPTRSPYQEVPQSLPDFSPICDVVPAPQLASMDSPTPASDLLSSPTVQSIASRSTPISSVAQARTPIASQTNPPALVYPLKSKILKSSVNILSTPMQQPREKKADPREQAIRGQLNAAVHSTGQRTLGSSVAPMSASRPTAAAVRSTPMKVQATPVSSKLLGHKSTLVSSVQATPRSMPPPVPSSIARPTLLAPASASRPVLAPLSHQRALQPVKSVSQQAAKPGRTISQLPKLVTKIPVIDAVAVKKPMPAPVAVSARSAVSVTGRSALALGAPSRLVGSRQVQGGSGRVLPSPARRLQAGREPIYSTYKPSNSFVFSAVCPADCCTQAKF